MIVHVDHLGRINLLDPWDFNRFKLRIADSLGRSDLADQLSGWLRLIEGGDEAWVVQDALRRMGPGLQDAAWQEGISTMIAKAKPHGWVEEATGAIRAHIEWAPT